MREARRGRVSLRLVLLICITFYVFGRMVVDGMLGCVAVPTILKKIVADNAHDRKFGEIKVFIFPSSFKSFSQTLFSSDHHVGT